MNKKKTDSNNIFYYSQDLQEILNLQLDLNMQEIGFIMVFKAAYIYHKGCIPSNKLCQFCRVFEKQETFVNFIENYYVIKGGFFYSEEYENIVKLIVEKSNKAKKSIASRWNTNVSTNVSTNEYTSTSNTNNNVNVNNNSSSLKDKSSEAKKAITLKKSFKKSYRLFSQPKQIKVLPFDLLTKYSNCIRKLGSSQELDNIIQDYLDYLKVAYWRDKKSFSAWINQPELYGDDWKAKKKEAENQQRTTKEIKEEKQYSKPPPKTDHQLWVEESPENRARYEFLLKKEQKKNE